MKTAWLLYESCLILMDIRQLSIWRDIYGNNEERSMYYIYVSHQIISSSVHSSLPIIRLKNEWRHPCFRSVWYSCELTFLSQFWQSIMHKLQRPAPLHYSCKAQLNRFCREWWLCQLHNTYHSCLKRIILLPSNCLCKLPSSYLSLQQGSKGILSAFSNIFVQSYIINFSDYKYK